jgi:hypothetical protein
LGAPHAKRIGTLTGVSFTPKAFLYLTRFPSPYYNGFGWKGLSKNDFNLSFRKIQNWE